jgi:hypothetical protein
MKRILVVSACALATAASARADSVAVHCTEGCVSRPGDATINLLLRPDEGTPLTLTWTFGEDPVPEGTTLTLFAGNPVLQDRLPDRGALKVTTAAGTWQASQRFTPDAIGRGTFLAVLVRKRGSDERILDWRAFRLLTQKEREAMEQDPLPQGAWSIDVRPAVLQATAGRGELPRATGGDERVWWPLARSGPEAGDQDLDGENNGIAGLGIQVSTPWEAGVGQKDWKQAVLDKLTAVEGHTVRFEGLRWIEAPERSLGDFEGLGPLVERHYYTLVTLYTNASVRSFDAREVGGGGLFSDPTYFSHETTARLKHTKDPRFWASYSLRDYGADPHLLELLRNQSRRDGTVPGLGPIQLDDGDGGSVVYRVGFVARARPWEGPPPGRPPFQAGFVGVDVVAARAGIGGVETHGSSGQPELQKAWCQVVRCGQDGRALDLDEPPSGYDVAQPVASLATLSGGVAMTEGKPLVAARGLEPNLPPLTRFALAANLRSGALVRKGSWGNARNVVPVNSYAQYVLKLTVAMVKDAKLVTSYEAVMPQPGELSVQTVVPRPTGFFAWLKRNFTIMGLSVILLASLALVIAVPGLRTALGALFKKK